MFRKKIEVRWSDLDANRHVTHTSYAAFATHARVEWLEAIGLPMSKIFELGVNGVLLKEQTEYFREIFLGEEVAVEVCFTGATLDFSRWKFVHYIYKKNNKLAAVYSIYGAWTLESTRKITLPPQQLVNILIEIKDPENFEIIS